MFCHDNDHKVQDLPGTADITADVDFSYIRSQVWPWSSMKTEQGNRAGGSHKFLSLQNVVDLDLF